MTDFSRADGRALDQMRSVRSTRNVTTNPAGSVAAGEDAINLYFTSVTSPGTSVRLARFTDFHDVCEISDDRPSLDPNE